MKEKAINLVLSLARQCREHKTSWCGGFHLDKSIFEFCQDRGALKYREMRSVNSLLTKIKKTEGELLKMLKEKFNHKKHFNWVLLHFDDGSEKEYECAFYPQSIGEDGAIISHTEEMREILKQNPPILEKNKEFKSALSEFIKTSAPMYEWIHQLFVQGILETEIEKFLSKKKEKKTQARISKTLVGNLIKPEITKPIEEDGSPPSLSIAERQTLQFLLWKADNMNETEKRLKDLLLDGKSENVKQNGVCVCFEENEAISNSYGAIVPAGFHYNEIKESLKTLSEKKLKLLLSNENEELKLNIPLVINTDFEHRYKHEPEFKKYVAVYVDARVLDLGGKYIAFPNDHFALLRHTPPKTKLTEKEIKFFDILYNEVSYSSKKNNTIRRKKTGFLMELDADRSFHENRLLSRLANDIENKYVEKALNLGLLEKFDIEINNDGEEVYVFTINAKEKISAFQN